MGRRKGTGCRVGNSVCFNVRVVHKSILGLPHERKSDSEVYRRRGGGLSAVGPDSVSAELNTNGLVKWTLSNQLNWLLDPR